MAALNICISSCEILEIMPESDLIDELYKLSKMQFEIMMHMLEGKHYGSDNLSSVVSYADNVKKEALRLKET